MRDRPVIVLLMCGTLLMSGCSCLVLGHPACGHLALGHLEQGDTYSDVEQWDEAITEYSKAIELNPVYTAAYGKRGYAYAKKGEFDKAIDDLDLAIELEPKFAQAYGYRGYTYAQEGQVAEAVSDLEKCIELSDDPVVVQAAEQLLDELR